MKKVYSRRIKQTGTKPRPRNAAGTRDAILASARRAFARSGYDGAGVREIAAEAGVTAMLVNRYFGSKEKLFAEVLADTMREPILNRPEILASPRAGEIIAGALVDITAAGTTPLDGFLILLHSASSPLAAAIGREQIANHHHRTMTAALPGPLAAERAAVVLSLVAGVQVMRQMIGLPALAEAEPQTLTRVLAPLFQQLVAGNA